jgi:hypothetical protein
MICIHNIHRALQKIPGVITVCSSSTNGQEEEQTVMTLGPDRQNPKAINAVTPTVPKILYAEVMLMQVRGVGSSKEPCKEIIYAINKEQLTGALNTKIINGEPVISFLVNVPLTQQDDQEIRVQIEFWKKAHAEQFQNRVLNDMAKTNRTTMVYSHQILNYTWWLKDKSVPKAYIMAEATYKLCLKKTAVIGATDTEPGVLIEDAMPTIFTMRMDTQYRLATSNSPDDEGDAANPILPPDQWFKKPAFKECSTSSPMVPTTFKRFRI